MGMSPESQKAKNEYHRLHYDAIKIRAVKGYRDTVLHEAAKRAGMSVNEYVMSTVADRISRDYPDIPGADAWKISQREGI